MSFTFDFTARDSSEGHADNSLKGNAYQKKAEEVPYTETDSEDMGFSDIDLSSSVALRKGLISNDKASIILGEQGVTSSDLIAGTYEGGFKLWECGIDLAKYLCGLFNVEETWTPQGKGLRALELGCGHGLPGIVAAKAGIEVHFQDYNAEVLKMLTIPNYVANLGAPNVKAKCKARFFSGGWSFFRELMQTEGLSGSYDYIFSSDSIYCPHSQQDILDCILEGLRTGGKAFIAAKAYYFGVGGSVGAFKALAMAKGTVMITSICDIDDGSSNKREVFCLTKQ